MAAVPSTVKRDNAAWVAACAELGAELRAAGIKVGTAEHLAGLSLEAIVTTAEHYKLKCDEYRADCEAKGEDAKVAQIDEWRGQNIWLFCPHTFTPNPCALAHQEGGEATATAGKKERGIVAPVPRPARTMM